MCAMQKLLQDEQFDVVRSSRQLEPKMDCLWTQYMHTMQE